MDGVTASAMKGVLIYAFNNERIDYFRQAVWSADRIRQYLGLPVTIVTDKKSQGITICKHDVIHSVAESGGTRIFNPSQDGRSASWFNASRYQSWNITPYQETIVLDSDYVVCSDQLLSLFDSDISVTAMKHVYDVTARGGEQPYRWISDQSKLHHYWATVLYFRKDQTAEDFFSMMTMIKNNYQHYCNIYHLPNHPFRNDFAASIALNTVYGHRPESVPEVPWSMATVFGDATITQIADDCFDLHYSVGAEKKPHRVRIAGQDFHFIDKQELAKLYAD